MHFVEEKHYNYDGTFEGLLTTFNLLFQSSEAVLDITSSEKTTSNLFVEPENVTTDSAAANAFFQALSQHFSEEVAREFIYCFLSETDGVEMLLYEYLRLLFKYGKIYSENRADSVVMKVKRLRLRVSQEIIRFQGFIRFRKLRNGLYYGAFEPDYNIIQLLSPHFKARFADQQWLLHDVRRDYGVFYSNGVCRFVNNPAEVGELTTDAISGNLTNKEIFDNKEETYQILWKDYFNSVAIANRDRRYIQRSCVPERYWKYLVETMGELPHNDVERKKSSELIIQAN